MSHITQRLSKFWKSSSMVVLHRLLRISTRSPCSRKSIEGRYRRGGGCRNFVGSLRVLVVPVCVCMCVCVYVCVWVCVCVLRMSVIWVSHGTHVNESCRTHEWVMSHLNECCDTYEWVMSRMWTSHVTHMNESRTCACVTWLIHVSRDSCTHVAWLIQICDLNSLRMWRDSLISVKCVTRLVHIRDVRHVTRINWSRT